MATGVQFRYNKVDFAQVSAIFIRGQMINARVYDLTTLVGNLMLEEARIRIVASGDEIAARVYESMITTTERLNEGTSITVGSTFQGYPTSPTDQIGNAGLAARRGWATLAHRLHFGYYPGAPNLRNKWNPRAGITEPAPFLIPVWDQYARQRGGFVSMLARDVIDPILRVRRV